MARLTRRAREILLAAFAVLLAISTMVVLLLTQTDWGRRHVLAFGLGELEKRVHGHVTIAAVYGNLLTGARLVDVAITDTAGRPFLRADTLRFRYSLRSLLRKHLTLSEVRVVNGVLVIDKPPGEEWNFARIFPTGPPKPHRGPGFGSWVLLQDMTLENTVLVVRQEWQPPAELRGAQRRQAIEHALSSDNRQWIVPVGNGYQSIAQFFDVRGRFPFMRLADPDSASRFISVNGLSMIALPFRPPAVRVRSLSARALITADSVFLDSVRMRLPNTRASGVGAYALDGGGARLQLTLPEANLDDARFVRPDAPDGHGSLQLAVTTRGDRTHFIGSHMNLRVERATIRGLADLEMGDGTFRVGPSDISYADVDTRLIRRYAPQAPLYAPGTLAGHIRLRGQPNDMSVDGWTTYDELRGPTSRITAQGRAGNNNGAFVARGLRLRFQPLHMSLLRGQVGDLPERGALAGTVTLNGSSRAGFAVVADLVDVDPAAGRSHILANGTVIPRNGITARNLRLRFAPLQLELVETLAPGLPWNGTLTGTTTLNGSPPAGFDVVADLVHESRETGRSHVTANGRISTANGIAAHSLRLGLRPLQVATLEKAFRPLPVDGVLVGRATVSGSAAQKRLATNLDLEHRGSTGVSHIIGRADASWAGRGSIDVSVRTPVLALATVGRFAPQAGLHGAASGRIVARGRLASLVADADLAIAGDNGAVRTHGVFDLAAARKRYDLTSTFDTFNAGAVISRLPETRLTGTVVARGEGITAATANATIAADLVGSRAAGGPVLDTTQVRARLTDGLATVERGYVRLASARADIRGDFGLIAGRSGTLRYTVEVDTLSQFMTKEARDTLVVAARPMVQARRIAQARIDSARIAQRTAVQRAAVGYPPPPRLEPDTLPLRRDTLAGSLRAEGTLTGNIERFDARGTAIARNFMIGSDHVGAGRADYTLTGFGSPDASVHVEAAADTLHVRGFAFDSAHAKLDYAGTRDRGHGSADIALYQDAQRDYRVQSDFNLALDRKQLAIQSLTMRFDTARWQAIHPAVIDWGKPGTVVDNLELRSNAGGYLRADGKLPTDGSADFRLDVEHLQLGDITVLLQDTGGVKGLLDLHAQVRGTPHAPVITGDLALAQAVYRGTSLPDVKSTISYAGRDLSTHTEFYRDSTRLAMADAHLPIDLALAGAPAERMQRNAPLQIDISADSLPLEALPSFTTAVSDVRGRIRGNATVRGTFDDPTINGIALLDLGSLRVNSTGVLYHDIVGTVRIRGDTAFIDSIVAYSGGVVRTTGKLAFETLTRPGFDLKVVADDAWLLDNEKGNVRADADLSVRGPYAGLHITGEADIKGGVLYAPETRNQHVTNLDDPTLRATLDTAALGLAVLPPPNLLLQNLQVDVRLHIEPDTWARNTQLNVEIFTPTGAEPLTIHMDNAHQVLTMTGVVHADHGEYSVAGRSLQLSTASATFLGGPRIDPLIELTAVYQVQRRGLEALVIQVHVDGNLSRPRVTLLSNAQPPLAQSDLLAYLAFGQPTSSLLNMQTSGLGAGIGGLTGLPALAQQQLASVALGATVDQAVADIEKQGTRSGLDVFRVHAGELPAEAAFQGYFQNLVRGTEIEAGKYISPRLFLEARGRTSTYPGLSLQYRNPIGLTWRWTWEPRYKPIMPSLSTGTIADQVRSLGAFLLYSRRF